MFVRYTDKIEHIPPCSYDLCEELLRMYLIVWIKYFFCEYKSIHKIHSCYQQFLLVLSLTEQKHKPFLLTQFSTCVFNSSHVCNKKKPPPLALEINIQKKIKDFSMPKIFYLFDDFFIIVFSCMYRLLLLAKMDRMERAGKFNS